MGNIKNVLTLRLKMQSEYFLPAGAGNPPSDKQRRIDILSIDGGLNKIYATDINVTGDGGRITISYEDALLLEEIPNPEIS